MKLKNEKKENTFLCAFRGIFNAVKSERNVKIDIIMAILVIVSGFILKIDTTEWFICLILIALVISAELMNTAIEAVVDMYTREKNPLAKRAKDIAAGSVLVLAIMSAIIGGIIFIPRFLEKIA